MSFRGRLNKLALQHTVRSTYVQGHVADITFQPGDETGAGLNFENHCHHCQTEICFQSKTYNCQTDDHTVSPEQKLLTVPECLITTLHQSGSKSGPTTHTESYSRSLGQQCVCVLITVAF